MLALLLLLLVVSVTAAVTIGPSNVGAADVWRVVGDHLGFSSDATPTENAIVWEIRLPRVLLAATVGAGLALVGAVMQATMRNPLADPYLLGISAGASFGAVVVFVGLGGATFGLTTGAFGGAMVAFAAVLVLGAGRAVADRPRADRAGRCRGGVDVRRRHRAADHRGGRSGGHPGDPLLAARLAGRGDLERSRRSPVPLLAVAGAVIAARRPGR